MGNTANTNKNTYEMKITVLYNRTTGKFFADCPIGSFTREDSKKLPARREAEQVARELAKLLGGVTVVGEPTPAGLDAWQLVAKVGY